MDAQRLQQFIQAAQSQGIPIEQINKYIEQRQKTQQVMDLVKSGLSPEEYETQQDIQSYTQKEGAKSQIEELLAPQKQARELEQKRAQEELNLEYLPQELGLRQQYELETAKKKKELDKEYTGEDLTEGQQTKQNLAKSAVKALKDVQAEFDKDPSIVAKQAIPGQFLSRKFDSALYNTIDALLRIRTGATANPTEIRGYMSKLGPTIGDSPEVAQWKIDQLKGALAEEGYLKPEEVEKMLPTKSGGMTGGNIGQANTPPSTPQGPRMNPLLSSFLEAGKNSMPGGGRVAYEATKFLNPNTTKVGSKLVSGKGVNADQLAGAGGEVLSNFLTAISGGALAIPKLAGAGAVRGATTPGQSPEQRTQSALLQGLLGGALGVAGKTPGFVKGNLTVKGIGAKRDAAVQVAKDVKVPTKPLRDAVESYVENDPTARKVAATITSSLKGKDVSLPKLMEKIQVWNDAYTKTGSVKSSAQAGVENILARTAKNLVKEKAPEVAKQTNKIANLYKTGGGLKKTAQIAGPTASILFLADQVRRLAGSK